MRSWQKIPTDLIDDEVSLELSPLAQLVRVYALLYAGKHLTDGEIPYVVATQRLVAAPALDVENAVAELATKKVFAFVLGENGAKKGVKIVGYLDHYKSRSEVEEIAAKRSKSGKLGGRPKSKEESKLLSKMKAKSNPNIDIDIEIDKEKEEKKDKKERKKTAAQPPVGRALRSLPPHLKNQLPDVMAALLQVHAVKGGKLPTEEAVAKALADYPRRRHVATARDLEAWMIHGNGSRMRGGDITMRYRRWLGKQDDLPLHDAADSGANGLAAAIEARSKLVTIDATAVEQLQVGGGQ